MTIDPPEKCPCCRSTRVRRHCDNPRCTWIACPACQAFGTRDASKWAPVPKPIT